jgi:predicted amidohydrolase YtcJ
MARRGRGAADRLILGRVASLGGSSGFGWVEGIAIAGGRVLATGSAAELESLAGPSTEVWRLPADLAVVPGITDAHLHLTTGALAASQLDLSKVEGRDATLAGIRQAHEGLTGAGDGGGWLLGHGWSLDRLGGWLTADDLEAVAPGRPVALWAHDHHTRWVSRAALRSAGITSARADPRGGMIRRGTDGNPTGMLHEGAAVLVDHSIPEPSAAVAEAALTSYAATLASLGVTGVHDPGQLVDEAGSGLGPWLYRDLAERGALPLRVVASVRERQLERAIAWGMRTGGAGGRDNGPAAVGGRYRDGWLKLFADGSLGSRSAALLAPYESDDPAGSPVGGSSGMLLRSPEELSRMAKRAADADIAVQIHAIGDAAVRSALDVLEALPRLAGPSHRVEHAQLIDPVDVPRFAKLGVAASVQPCHLCTDTSIARVAWGERSANAFPLRDLDAAGALIPFGTDAPVERPDPWRGLAAAVSRSDPTWKPDVAPLHQDQALPVSRALRAACLDPAQSLGLTDEGRLTPGARADLLVVPVRGLDEPGSSGADLASIRPLATLIDGEVNYRAPVFDPVTER